MKFLILNGPNVNLQRYSEPGMPGELDYNGMMDYVQSGCDQMGIETDVCQTNHEGDLIDEIQAAAGRVDGIVLNPGGYAHTSVAILDALRLCGVPAVEVLLTAPDERVFHTSLHIKIIKGLPCEFLHKVIIFLFFSSDNNILFHDCSPFCYRLIGIFLISFEISFSRFPFAIM